MDQSLAVMLWQLCYGKISFIVLVPGWRCTPLRCRTARWVVTSISWPKSDSGGTLGTIFAANLRSFQRTFRRRLTLWEENDKIFRLGTFKQRIVSYFVKPCSDLRNLLLKMHQGRSICFACVKCWNLERILSTAFYAARLIRPLSVTSVFVLPNDVIGGLEFHR